MIGDLKEDNQNSNTIYDQNSQESKEKSKINSENSFNNEDFEDDQIFLIIKDKRHYKCNYCGKLFKENGNLKTHLRLHSGIKPYMCKFQNCGKKFVTLGNLRSHEFNHTENKPFKCIVEGCNRFYSRQCRLDIHLRTHYNLKPYKCPYEDCEKSFNEKGNLKTHVRIHTGEKPFLCDFPGCGISFKAHGHLKDHKKRHTNYRPYKCHLCDNSFARSSTLKIHLHTHKGDKPHKCPFPNCNKTFTEKGNMKTHYKNHLDMKTLDDIKNPEQLLKTKRLRLAAFKENPFKKNSELEKPLPVLNLEIINNEANIKNDNLKILKNLENFKNIIEKQEREDIENIKSHTKKIRLKNPVLKIETNRKRSKVVVADNYNSFSFDSISNNTFMPNNQRNSYFSYIDSAPNTFNSIGKSNTASKHNLSFADAIQDYNNKKVKNVDNEKIHENNSFGYLARNSKSLMKNFKDEEIENLLSNNIIKIETFPFSKYSSQCLENEKLDFDYLNHQNKLKLNHSPLIDKENQKSSEENSINHFQKSTSSISQSQSESIQINSNNKIYGSNPNINTSVNFENLSNLPKQSKQIITDENLFNFSNISTFKDYAHNNQNLNNSNIPNKKSIKENHDCFLKPKDVPTPISYIERLLNENANNKDELNIINNLNVHSNSSFTNVVNANLNLGSNSAAQLISKNLMKINNEIKEIPNSSNINQLETQNNFNNVNFSKHLPVINFSQLSSLSMLKNPIIEQKGTPVNLNTISSIHSNNFERNYSSNVNFEYMPLNYNINQNLSNFNSLACNNLNNNTLINNKINNLNQNLTNNLNNLDNLNYGMINLNNIVCSAANDNNNIMALIGQSPRNTNIDNNYNLGLNNLNNSLNTLTSPKNLVSNLMPNNIVNNLLSANNNNSSNINNSMNNYNQSSDFFNFMNLNGANTGIPNFIGSTPMSQQNISNLNMINPMSPSVGNGYLNFSEISKYRNHLNADNLNCMSIANSSILNYNMGNSSNTNIDNNLNNFCEKTPISALKSQLNETNLINNFKIPMETKGDETAKSIRSNKSNPLNLEEINSMYDNLINKLEIIKTNNQEYYNECCENYKNLIQDSDKRIYIILKIICDYERLYNTDSENKQFSSNYTNSLNGSNKSSGNTPKVSNNITAPAKFEDFSSKNLNTFTNMNSTNNVTSCKSSPWVNPGAINSFGDLAMSYFNKLNYQNTNQGNDLNKQNFISPRILSPANRFNQSGNYIENINKDSSPINARGNNMMGIIANTINFSNLCSPVSITGNNSRGYNDNPINRVRNQPTFSDFVKNIPKSTEEIDN